MRLTKKSLFIVLIFALVILAGFSGKYPHTEKNRAVSEPALAASPTEMAMDSGGNEVFGEQDFSYSALVIPMIPSTVGTSTMSGGLMTLMEK